MRSPAGWPPVQSSAARMPASGPGKPGTSSATTGKAERGEARGIAIGIEDQSAALGRKARDHAFQDGAAADAAHRLVAAAHAAREAAGEQHPMRRWNCQSSPPSPLRLCLADSSST